MCLVFKGGWIPGAWSCMSAFHVRWLVVKYCTRGILNLTRVVWKTQMLKQKALRNTSDNKQKHKYEKSVEHRNIKGPQEEAASKIKPQIHKSSLKPDGRDNLIFEGRGTSSFVQHRQDPAAFLNVPLHNLWAWPSCSREKAVSCTT